MTTPRITLGSVCRGSTLNEDIIPALCDALDDIREQLALPGPTTEPVHDNQERRRKVAELDTLLGRIEHRGVRKGYFDSEQAGFDLELLVDTLNDYAPPYCYFGVCEGDGSDYGFWVDRDQLQEDRDEGDLPSGDSLPEDRWADWEYYLHVSDHGNMELYQWSGTEWVSLWSVV